MTPRCIAFSSADGSRCVNAVGSSSRQRSHCVCADHDWSHMWQAADVPGAGDLRDPRVDAVRQRMAVDPWDHVLILLKTLEALNTPGARIVVEALRWTRF